MKIKLIGLVALFAFAFSSCNDNISSMGGNIQPSNDTITIATDTFQIAARTISLKDSIYARTIYGLLGRYQDDLVGSVQSDYMCQFYCPENANVGFDSHYLRIDSAQIGISFSSYAGDSLAPMGLSVYKLDKQLEGDYFTDFDPSAYYSPDSLLAQTSYTIKGLPFYSTTSSSRTLIADLGVRFGESFYNASKNTSNNPFVGPEAFNEFFPGVYITTSFGVGSLIKVANTSMGIYYTCKQDTITATNPDSVMYSTKALFFSVTPEVVQLNRAKNEIPQSLLTYGTSVDANGNPVDGSGASYLKSPAGMCTEISLPIKDVLAKAGSKMINTAHFKVKGYTEDEVNLGFARPTSLLLINRDSVVTFFARREIPDRVTSFLAIHDTKSNTYDFGNLSQLINTYRDNGGLDVNPTFVILPVDLSYQVTSTGAVVSGVYNSMNASSAIFRADNANMKLELIYSNF